MKSLFLLVWYLLMIEGRQKPSFMSNWNEGGRLFSFESKQNLGRLSSTTCCGPLWKQNKGLGLGHRTLMLPNTSHAFTCDQHGLWNFRNL
jgi:hypothetical protein